MANSKKAKKKYDHAMKTSNTQRMKNTTNSASTTASKDAQNERSENTHSKPQKKEIIGNSSLNDT